MLKRFLPLIQHTVIRNLDNQLPIKFTAKHQPTLTILCRNLLTIHSNTNFSQKRSSSTRSESVNPQLPRNMFIVAITGGIATGKSTVTSVFREQGVPVVDADVIAREVVEVGKPAWKKIRTEFGDEILNNDKSINRERLGKIIFADVEKRRFLNAVTHPEIHNQMYKEIVRHAMAGHNFVLVDMPLLFETGIMLPYVHKIITVVCEEDLQLTRLMDRNKFSEADAKQRIASQMSLEEKCKQSHFVVENSGTVRDTEEQVMRILDVLRQSNQHWKLRGIVLATTTVFFGVLTWLLNLKFGFLQGILY